MAFLIISSSATDKRKYQLSRDVTTVGRSSMCDIHIDDHEISRLHCSIHHHGNENFTVIDTASKNGTFLNKERLLHAETALTDGDHIGVGKTTLTFHTREPAPDTRDAFDQIAQEMEQGKGYQTIFQEITGRPPRGSQS